MSLFLGFKFSECKQESEPEGKFLMKPGAGVAFFGIEVGVKKFIPITSDSKQSMLTICAQVSNTFINSQRYNK